MWEFDWDWLRDLLLGITSTVDTAVALGMSFALDPAPVVSAARIVSLALARAIAVVVAVGARVLCGLDPTNAAATAAAVAVVVGLALDHTLNGPRDGAQTGP